MMDKEIKKSLREYKEKLLREKKEREQLLNSKVNFGALENFIQRCNEDPNLKITIELKDGTVIHLQTVTKKYVDPYVGE